MQITTQRKNSANSKANAKVSKKTLDEKKSKVAKDIARHAAIKGFRKGKAPVALIQSTYVNEIFNEARKEIMDDVVNAALKELKIENEALFTTPYVSDYKENDGELEFEITICERPTIVIKDVEKLIDAPKDEEVTDAEVDERVANLLKASAPLVKVEKKRKLENGDFALMDFEGFIGDKAFDGGKANDYLLEIGSGSFIPGFEDGMLGMKAGESKDINVKFPESYGSSDLAGKDSVFKVTLKEIQTKQAEELNDESAKKILTNDPEATVAKVKEEVKKQLVREKGAKKYADEVKPAILTKLTETFIFDLPESVVEQEMDMLARNKLQTLSEEELEKLRDGDNAKTFREGVRDEAEKNVRITFIIDELAKNEGVTVHDQEVAQAIMMEALQGGMDPMKLLETYKQHNLLPAVKMAIIEDRVLLKLVEKTKKAAK